MTRSSTRRRYLTAGVAAGAAALAGCTDVLEGDDGSGDPSNESQGGNDSQNESGGDTVDDIDYEEVDGELSFVSPEDGAQVSSPVSVEMNVEGLELEAVDEEESSENGVGHLHVIVDHGCIEPSYVIPQEDGYHHLSEGGQKIELELEPGEHDLCAQAGDGIHNAYALTDEITIEVTEGGGGGNESDGGNETDGGNESTEGLGNAENGTDVDDEQ